MIQKTKTKINIKIIAIASIITIAISIYFTQLIQQSNTKKTDILTNLLGANPNFSADFTTNTINKYTGPTSPIIETCRDSVNTKNTRGVITADFNPNFSTNLNRSEILNDIGPILGHAVKNSEINWKWNPNEKQYTFYSHEEDTAFWKCYFQKETIFFKDFFTTESILTDSEVLIFKKSKIKMFISENKNLISSKEIGRDIFITPSNKIKLGYLNVEIKDQTTQDLFSKKLSEFNNILDIKPEILISSPETQRDYKSSNETMRNEKYPFINVEIFSSSEIIREKAIEHIQSISITEDTNPITIDQENSDISFKPEFTKHYKITLIANEELPDEISLQMYINPNFSFSSKILKEKIEFLGSHYANNIFLKKSLSFQLIDAYNQQD